MLSAAGNHYHLSSGQIFRGLSPESRIGQMYFEYAHAGKLVPDEVTLDMFKTFMQGLIDTNRFHPSHQLLLLDGIPRTVHQAKLLEKLVQIKHVIVLNISNEREIIRRINRRALIEKRADDASETVIIDRIKTYNEVTSKIIDLYSKQKTSTINAANTPMEVLRDVLVSCTHILKQLPLPVPQYTVIKDAPSPITFSQSKSPS